MFQRDILKKSNVKSNFVLLQVKSAFPGFLLNSPTLIDLDGNGSDSEIVIGTSGGHVHVLNSDGTTRRGFPITTDSLHGQVFNVIPDKCNSRVLRCASVCSYYR